MRLMFVLFLAVAGCTQGTGVSPLEGLRGLVDPADADRRAAVELEVKSAFPAILTEIGNGGGPALTRAFDAAGVPDSDRSARIIQLDGDLGLYAENPGALSLAIATYGRSRTRGG